MYGKAVCESSLGSSKWKSVSARWPLQTWPLSLPVGCHRPITNRHLYYIIYVIYYIILPLVNKSLLLCDGFSCDFQGAEHCHSCLNFKDGPYCVTSCPALKYPDADGACQPCHPNCRGCVGPSDELGDGGCLACSNLLLDVGSASKSCLNETVTECPLEFYFFRGKVRLTSDETVVSRCRTDSQAAENSGIWGSDRISHNFKSFSQLGIRKGQALLLNIQI